MIYDLEKYRKGVRINIERFLLEEYQVSMADVLFYAGFNDSHIGKIIRSDKQKAHCILTGVQVLKFRDEYNAFAKED